MVGHSNRTLLAHSCQVPTQLPGGIQFIGPFGPVDSRKVPAKAELLVPRSLKHIFGNLNLRIYPPIAECSPPVCSRQACKRTLHEIEGAGERRQRLGWILQQKVLAVSTVGTRQGTVVPSPLGAENPAQPRGSVALKPPGIPELAPGATL